MCYVKRAPSPPSAQIFPIQDTLQDACGYVFPETCMTSQISWPELAFLPSPISNSEVESMKSEISFPMCNSEESLKRKSSTTDLAVKRQKNKEAAARSREKKLNRLLELETQVKILEEEKSVLSLQLAISESEKKAALIREEEYKIRILKLEEYLYKKDF